MALAESLYPAGTRVTIARYTIAPGCKGIIENYHCFKNIFFGCSGHYKIKTRNCTLHREDGFIEFKKEVEVWIPVGSVHKI